MKASDYCIVVEGELGPRYAAAFGSMRLDARHGTTEITGRIQDEAELRGLLDAVSELGLSLVSVTPVGDQRGAETGRDRQPLRHGSHSADSPG